MKRIVISGQSKGPVYLQLCSDEGQCEKKVRFETLLTDSWEKKDSTELQWYMEDFVKFPHGADIYRAERFEKRYREWGHNLFWNMFGPNSAGAEIYNNISNAKEFSEIAFEVISTDPVFLNLPWEALNDSRLGNAKVAIDWKGIFRSFPSPTSHSFNNLFDSQPNFKILLVISRPGRFKDVDYLKVAGPLFKALLPHIDQINLEVLRPPTFEKLKWILSQRKGEYHIVHFDGHGYMGLDGEGKLLFEGKDEASRVVSAKQLAEIINIGSVPWLILNACQSYMEDVDRPFSSVASEVFKAGAQAVIAMKYSILADSAMMLFSEFYKSIAKGLSIVDAITQGRKLLAKHSQSVIQGSLVDFQDWSVPVLFLSESSILAKKPYSAFSKKSEAETVVSQTPEVVAYLPEYPSHFIGRDQYFLAMEGALKSFENTTFIVTGLTGIGKSLFLRSFAYWYYFTKGCKGVVFLSLDDFSDSDGFFSALHSISLPVTKSQHQNLQELWIHYFRKNKLLLIIDQYEKILDEKHDLNPPTVSLHWKELNHFIERLDGGKTRLILCAPDCHNIAPGTEFFELPIRGLNSENASQFAYSVLKQEGVEFAGLMKDPDFFDLLDVFDGHPQALKLILPQLKYVSPGELEEKYFLDEFEPPQNSGLQDKWNKLSESAKKVLPFAGTLCSSNLRSRTLGYATSEIGELSDMFNKDFQESISPEQWMRWLTESHILGITVREDLELDSFKAHPFFAPWMRLLAKRESGQSALDYLGQYLSPYWEFQIGALASLSRENASILRTYAEPELRNTYSWLRWAVNRRNGFFALGLRNYYIQLSKWIGFTDNANWIQEKLFRIFGDKLDNQDSWDWVRFQLDVCLDIYQSKSNLGQELELYEKALRRLLKNLDEFSHPEIADVRGRIFHNLATIALADGKSAMAEEYTKNAISYFESENSADRLATEYHTLGIIYKEWGKYDLAEKYLNMAYSSFNDAGMSEKAMNVRHSLATLPVIQGESGKSDKYLYDLLEDSRNESNVDTELLSYIDLGQNALHSDQLDEAEDWLRKGIELSKVRDNLRILYKGYLLLGQLNIKRENGTEAYQWLDAAMKIIGQDGAQKDIAYCFYLMSMACVLMREPSMGQRFLESAEEIYREIGMEAEADKMGELSALLAKVEEERGIEMENADLDGREDYRHLMNMSDRYLDQGNLTKALEMATSALALAKENGNLENVYEAHTIVGRIYYYKDEFEKSREHSLLAIKGYEDLHKKEKAAYAYHQLSRCSQSLGDYSESLRYLKIEEKLLVEEGSQIPLAACYAQQGYLWRHWGNYRRALECYLHGQNIATSHHPRLAGSIVTDLARLLKVMGEELFVETWKELTNDQNPPLNHLRKVIQSLEKME